MASPEVSEISSSSLPDNASAAVILFTAKWHDACASGGPMDQLLRALAMSSSSVYFARCDAEDQADLAEQFGIEQVPTFCLLNKKKEDWFVVNRLTGDDPSAVTSSVQRLLQAVEDDGVGQATTTRPTPVQPNPATTLKQRLESLISSHPVMVFIKGSPDQPQCGFSRQIVELLRQDSIAFGSFDILTDDAVRQGLKKHSDWPTYPQLYVKGELVGGLDIVKDLQSEGSLAEQLGVESTHPHKSLEALVRRSPVMLFMKGLPSQPRCGFSRKIVEMLEEYEGVPLDAFDILTDETVRQGLKEYSKWPTYPQLYVNGELVGGLDIVQEMHEDGSLKDVLETVVS